MGGDETTDDTVADDRTAESEQKQVREEFARLQARVVALCPLVEVLKQFDEQIQQMPDAIESEAPALLDLFDDQGDIERLIELSQETARSALSDIEVPLSDVRETLRSLKEQLQDNRDDYLDATGVDEGVLNRMVEGIDEALE